MATQIKVLIVEADNTSANTIKEQIETEGYEVVSVATNGMTALQALNSLQFDLAIVDSGLPSSWSETVLHALNKKETAAPLVLLHRPETGEPHKLKNRYAHAAYLPKPFSKSQLLAAAAKASQGRALLTPENN